MSRPAVIVMSVAFAVTSASASAEQFQITDEILDNAFVEHGVRETAGTIAPSVGCPGSVLFEFESTWFRFYHAEGNADPFGDLASSDFEFAPRYIFGYKSANGWGYRARYWDYDAQVATRRTLISTDTYIVDAELFQGFLLANHSTLELSAGLRYNDFEYQQLSGVFTNWAFDGVGGVLGVEFERRMGAWGAFTGRYRDALLKGNGDNRFSNPIEDVTRRISEFSFGYQLARCIGCARVTASVGTEWQIWTNYVGARRFLQETEDVGFHGLVLGVAIDY